MTTLILLDEAGSCLPQAVPILQFAVLFWEDHPIVGSTNNSAPARGSYAPTAGGLARSYGEGYLSGGIQLAGH